MTTHKSRCSVIFPACTAWTLLAVLSGCEGTTALDGDADSGMESHGAGSTEWTDCSEKVANEFPWADMTPLGFSALDVLGSVLGRHEQQIEWTIHEGVGILPDRRPLNFVVELHRTPSVIEYVKSTPRNDAVDPERCVDHLRVDVSVALHSDNAAFDEDELDATFYVENHSAARLELELHDDMHGSFKAYDADDEHDVSGSPWLHALWQREGEMFSKGEVIAEIQTEHPVHDTQSNDVVLGGWNLD